MLKVGGDTLAGRISGVRSRIAAAAIRAGRAPEAIRLVAVTKTIPLAAVREAAAAGQLLFGESRVQEARLKIPALGPGFTWHLLGHVQRNKAKAAVELFDVVESLDSAELARDLDRRAGEAGKRLQVLVQVKVSAEEAKSGVAVGDAPALIELAAGLPHLNLAGLMCIPPAPPTPEDSRPWFARLRELRERWEGSICPRGLLGELSMGMSGDFEVAVEEGATLVRVGSAIFGERARP